MDLHDYCPQKLVSAKEAISKIKRGSQIFIGSGSGEPTYLIKALVKDENLYDIMIYQMLSWSLADYMDDASFLKRFSLKLFFISSNMRKARL